MRSLLKLGKKNFSFKYYEGYDNLAYNYRKTYQKISNQDNRKLDLSYENIFKSFKEINDVMKKDSNPTDLDYVMNREFLLKESLSEIPKMKGLILNELDSIMNSIVNVLGVGGSRNLTKLIKSNFEELEAVHYKIWQEKEQTSKVVDSQKLTDFEHELFKRMHNVQNPNKTFDKSQNFQRDYYESAFFNLSAVNNDRINLDIKLFNNPELKSINLGNELVHITSINDSEKLDWEDKDFKRINFAQDAKAPALMHDLMVVVQNPGIFKVEDLNNLNRQKVEFFENIPDPSDINFQNLETFVPPYKDKNLAVLAEKHRIKYVSSTSGIGGLLNHLFFKLTNFKMPHFYNLSEAYEKEPLRFMLYQRKPICISLKRHPEGYYSISGDKTFEHRNETILMGMGKYMEKLFTTDTQEFKKKYRISGGGSKMIPEAEKEKDFYTFMCFSNTLLRSQIDCIGKNKQNKEIFFEIKTRAVCPIRYDLDNYTDYLDYEIKTLLGKYQSFEREFYDLIRGAFLKYLFQIKIGGMEGAFISYHNTKKIFGFEYITLEDMQRRIFGSSNFSDIIFKVSLRLLEKIMDKIIEDFGGESDNLKIGFFANEGRNCLDVFVEVLYNESYSNVNNFEFSDVIDYYYLSKYKPKAFKYSVYVYPILNDLISVFTPLLFEKFDNYMVRFNIIFQGKVTFDEYMKFLHEAHHSKSINLENEYAGSWSGIYH